MDFKKGKLISTSIDSQMFNPKIFMSDTHIPMDHTFDHSTRDQLNVTTTIQGGDLVPEKNVKSYESTFHSFHTDSHIKYSMFLYGNKHQFKDHYEIYKLYALMMNRMQDLIEQMELDISTALIQPQ